MAAQARMATDAFRDVAEESAAQAKENLETMRTAAGEAPKHPGVQRKSS